MMSDRQRQRIGLAVSAMGFLWLVLAVGTLPAYAGKGIPTMVTDKYVFMDVKDENLFGEGFFVNFKNGGEIFVYGVPDKDPRNIEGVRLKIKAILKSKEAMRYPSPKKKELYLSTKYDLGAEHRLLPPSQYAKLALLTRERGMKRTVKAVPFEEIKASDIERRFSCAAITGVGDVTMTSGGSVHIFTISLADGVHVNVDLGVKDPNGVEALWNVRQDVLAHTGEDCDMVITNPVYLDTQYTMLGAVTKVWATSWKRIFFEDGKGNRLSSREYEPPQKLVPQVQQESKYQPTPELSPLMRQEMEYEPAQDDSTDSGQKAE